MYYLDITMGWFYVIIIQLKYMVLQHSQSNFQQVWKKLRYKWITTSLYIWDVKKKQNYVKSRKFNYEYSINGCICRYESRPRKPMMLTFRVIYEMIKSCKLICKRESLKKIQVILISENVILYWFLPGKWLPWDKARVLLTRTFLEKCFKYCYNTCIFSFFSHNCLIW